MPQSTYYAVMDRNGGLQAGYAEMALIDEVTPAQMPPSLKAAQNITHWFVDSNWSASVLQTIADAKPNHTHLSAAAVSEEKLDRLAPILGQIDTLFMNTGERNRLAEQVGLDPMDESLRHRLGVELLIVSDGMAPLLVYEGDRVWEVAIPSAPVKNVSGAGDSLCGGYLAARITGLEIEDALQTAVAVARETLQAEGSIPKQFQTGIMKI